MKQVGKAKGLLYLLTKKPQQKVRLYVCMLSLLSSGSLLIHNPTERLRLCLYPDGEHQAEPQFLQHIPKVKIIYQPACKE